MSTRRRLQGFLSLVAFLTALALGPATSAQVMDGVWFKLTISAKGVGIEPDGSVVKAKQKFVSYMFVSNFRPEAGEGGSPSAGYSFQIFHEAAPGVWLGDVSGNMLVLGPNEEFLDTLQTTFYGPDAVGGGGGKEGAAHTGFDGVFNGEFKIKTDARGQFKSASFKSLGGVAPEGAVDGDTSFAGGFTVKGKSVAQESLPFDL